MPHDGSVFSARSSHLFAAYEKWCAAEREDAGTPRSFGDAMKAKGFESYRSNGIHWRGIGLRGRGRRVNHG